MAGQMYFGTQARMTWVKCPDTGMGMGRTRWSAEGTYLNGGGFVRESTAGHLIHEMSWNFLTRDQLRAITDYREGVYGDGLLYFLDPFQMDRNILPQHWAFPALAGDDGMSLLENERPVLADAPANTLNAPTKTAVYLLDENSVTRTVWLPVPDGYSLHVGGLLAGAGTAAVTATPDSGSAVNLQNDLTTTPHNYHHRVLSSVGGGVTLSLTGEGGLNLWCLGAQVLPDGRTPTTTTFQSGQGTSGSRFVGDPTITGYSAARDHVALGIRLKETGAWDE